MTKKILQYIFNEITDTSMHYSGYGSPWIHSDGRIYTTNGKILLCLENTEDRSEAFTDNGEKHPNIDGLIPPFDEESKVNHYVKLDALESFEGYCDLAGTSISDKVAQMIAKILRLFGMEGAFFDKADRNMLIFKIFDSDKVTGMLLCADQTKETDTTDVTLLFIDTILKPMKARLYDALVDGDKGKEYFKQCLERDKEEQGETHRP